MHIYSTYFILDDHSRVYLSRVDDDPLTEYINANFIEVEPYLYIHFNLVNKFTILANYASFESKSFGGHQTLTIFCFQKYDKETMVIAAQGRPKLKILNNFCSNVI